MRQERNKEKRGERNRKRDRTQEGCSISGGKICEDGDIKVSLAHSLFNALPAAHLFHLFSVSSRLDLLLMTWSSSV